MRKWSAVVVLGMVVFLDLRPASAQQVCDAAVTLRVAQRGLDFVARQVKPLVPTQLQLPAVSKVVFDWPLTSNDAEVQIEPLGVSIDLRQLRLWMDGDTLRIVGRADISTAGPVRVENAYAGFGTAECRADIAVKDLGLDVGLQLEMAEGRVKAVVTQAELSMDNKQSVIALEDCALGEILTAVVTFVRKHFLGFVLNKVESIAKEQVPAAIADKLGQTIQISREFKGLRVTGRLDRVATTAGGVEVDLGAGIELAEQIDHSCVAEFGVPPAPTCGAAKPKLSSKVDAMFGVAVSEAILNRALHTAWRGGMLCIDSQTLPIPTIAQGLDKLATTLGQAPGTKLSFTLRLHKPPRVRLAAGEGLRLLLEGIDLRLRLTPPEGVAGELGVQADLQVAATPWIDPAGNSVALDLHQVSVAKLALLGAAGAPAALQIDPARLQRFVTDVGLPLLRSKLDDVQLSPSVVSAASMLVELKQVQLADGYLAAYVDAHQPTPVGDVTPPETLLLQSPAPLVGPQVIRLVATGIDNDTPAALLQFKARVDGGEWTAPRFGGRVDVATVGGLHVVEIAAVDHEGNADPTPLALTFVVDDVAPELTIVAEPRPMLEGDSAEVGFTARDDRTSAEALTYRVQLLRVPDGGGQAEVVESRDLPWGAMSARFDGLADGVYKIRVIVRDEAGNVTSADSGFVVANQGGCSAAPGTSVPTPATCLLALLALLVLRRRR